VELTPWTSIRRRHRARGQDEQRPASRSSAELGKRIIGQSDVIELILLSLFVGGNSLIVGVPGLAKTLLIATLRKGLDLQVQPHPVHARPDAVGHHRHRHHQGDAAPAASDGVRARARSSPNIVLADEINRTPPKTQSALLEAMQEHRVTIQGAPTS
jgi:MoxR-like ATPase